MSANDLPDTGSADTSTLSIQQLQQALDQCATVDRPKLIRGLRQLRERRANQQPVDKLLLELSSLVAQSSQKVFERKAAVPVINYPDALPIALRRDEIAETITNHQVVVIAGETGSGKTTQLPKICLELGLGSRGLIGHTQPRRIAARTVASRIAEELQTPLGELVGYQVRFNDQSSDNTSIKLMTDGILLAEIQNDRFLNKYQTIIIDEAHERSLNIDFLLGYLKQLLPKRPDLKIIITSATIDLEKFSQHFDNAPVIEVSGRTFPVEVLYRPPAEEQDDLSRLIIDALEEVLELPQRGDVLVFLSGEREIREVALEIRKAQLAHVEVLPLYARLSLAEQNKVFQPHKGVRVVLATNVAETSITVPGIRYVIDPGTARISRYSYRTKIQRLPIEPISQASANQRKGRCGRVADGVCIRLYSEEDFNNRPEFTDPEIVRTNLAAVILQMMQLRIGDIRQFTFVDAPDNRLINDGFQLLQELGAVNRHDRLTELGKKLCRLPVDPRLGRMLLAAEQESALREVLIVISALSMQDPRERPAEKKQAADQAHARWRDKNSDFLALINLWDDLEAQRQALSGNQFSKYCHRNFISYLRVREWRDLQHQLHHSVRELKLRECSARNKQPDQSANNELGLQSYHYAPIHRALLTGQLNNIGHHFEDREYSGTRNRKFMIFPGSGLFKKQPKWLMCGELLETSKLYAHNVASIESEWLPELAAHLVKKSYSEPHYDAKSGQVMAFEKQTLYGLTIVEKRRCSYGKIDPVVSREVFIQGCLVEGRYRGKGRFYTHNQQLLAELDDMEARFRRRDILVEEQVIYQFFDERLPAGIVNLAGFEHWRKATEQNNADLLCMDRELLMQRVVSDTSEVQFPDTICWEGAQYPLSYRFELGHAEDGVTVTIPLAALHQVPKYRFEWLVPGMLRDKCIALLKLLPKPIRRNFVPVPSVVDKVLPALSAVNTSLTDALAAQLKRHTAVDIAPESWRLGELDLYYQMNFRLVDDNGQPLAMSRNLEALQEQYRGQVQASIRESADPDMEQEGITHWDFGELPDQYQSKRGGLQVRSWPALIDQQESVALKLLDHPEAARNLTRKGLVRLLLLQHNQPQKYLSKQLLKNVDLKLVAAGLPKRDQLLPTLIFAAYQQTFFDVVDKDDALSLPRNSTAFEGVIDQCKGDIVGYANELEAQLLSLLDPMIQIRKTIKKLGLAAIHGAQDISQQLDFLFQNGFLTVFDKTFLQQYPRYIKAIQVRLEKIQINTAKDRQATLQLEKLRSRLDSLPVDENEWATLQQAEVRHYQLMLQELRVSLFAQQLKTAIPVSEKRLEMQWQAVVGVFS